MIALLASGTFGGVTERTKVAVSNQLRSELERVWPGPIGLFCDLDSEISLAFLERDSAPADAGGLGETRLSAFLGREHYSGGQKPARLLAKLPRAPEARIGEAELKARRALVLALVAALKTLVGETKTLERQLAAGVRAHPDGEISTSLFRGPGSVICPAALLSEIGDCRARSPTGDTLAADSGQAAIAIESGKRKAACFRGCNKPPRCAFPTLADSTRRWHPWAQDRYANPQGPWPRSSTCDPNARPCPVPDRPALLAGPRPPRPGPPPGTATTHHPHHPHHVRAPPDLAATQRTAAATITHRPAQRAQRDALDGKPTPATTLRGRHKTSAPAG